MHPPARLRVRPAFLHVQNTGARFKGRLLTLLVARVSHAPNNGQARTNSEIPKIGFTVSRKVGNAVARNQVRRRLREIVRLDADALVPAGEHVIIAYPAARTADYGALKQEILCLLRRAQTWASRPGRRGSSSNCTAVP